MQKKHKIQHFSMINILNKLGIKENFLNMTKGIYENPQLTSHSGQEQEEHMFILTPSSQGN